MKKLLGIGTLICLLVSVAYSLTNIVLTVPLSDSVYTNMFFVASNHNMTVDTFLLDSVMREVKDQQFSIMVELWHKATPVQQENALNALRNP